MTQNVINKQDLRMFIEDNNIFALELYKKLSRNKTENIAVSPMSISIALAMTYTGSRGKTKKQIENILHFDKLKSKVHPAFSKLMEELLLKEDGNGQSLLFANHIWGQKGYAFLPEFTNILNKYYHSGFETVDFVHKTEKARERINQWVAIKTKKKIKELIGIQDLTSLTRLVLTNAIYFKGKWASQFKKEETKNMLFYLTDRKTIQVPMMYQEGVFPFSDFWDERLKVIELPYMGDALSMILFLPESPKELKRFEQELTVQKMKKLIASLRKKKVMIYLPRFHLNRKYYLKERLSKMGMSDAFSDRADFSGMTGSKDLKISKVIHQVDINVNEEGTKAAAATAVVVTLKAMEKTSVFNANHPFVFVILNKHTGSILFMGRVVKPLK